MHSGEVVANVLRLRDQGLNHCEISRRTGIPRATARDWANGKLPYSFRRKAAGGPGTCSRCGANAHRFDELSSAYAYLLGLYLGDGCISAHPRGVFKLRIALDVKYPNIVDEATDAIRAVLPWNEPNQQLTPKRYVEVYSYSKSWPCLLPQHGAGRKHHRRIAVTEWQRALIDLAPELLLRGLIHSDGCRFTNTRGKSDNWSAGRYAFDNLSTDIRNIFCATCDRLALHWTAAGPSTIYVSRKADVAAMDRFIGPKS